jgi:hypothetical protein
MTSDCKSRRRFLLPLGLKRPNRSNFFSVTPKKSSDNGKRCSSGLIICLKASLLLGWLIPFLYWTSSNPRPIELDSNGIPSDLRLRKAALKEYHHHLKRKPKSAPKQPALTNSIGGDKLTHSTVADKFPKSEIDSSNEENTADAIGKQANIEKGRLSIKNHILSALKPKVDSLGYVSVERGTFTVPSDSSGAKDELNIDVETIVLSRKDRLSARIGCDWKRGPQALLVEDTSNTFFKKGAFFHFHDNAHPNIEEESKV